MFTSRLRGTFGNEMIEPPVAIRRQVRSVRARPDELAPADLRGSRRRARAKLDEGLRDRFPARAEDA